VKSQRWHHTGPGSVSTGGSVSRCRQPRAVEAARLLGVGRQLSPSGFLLPSSPLPGARPARRSLPAAQDASGAL